MLVLFAYGYFYNAHNWNHIARFDPIFSFVEADTPDRGSFRIDHFIVNPVMGRNTGDWARNPEQGEHYYSNKAPGPFVLGVPLYAALYHVERALGAVPESQSWTRINTQWINWLLSVLPAAIAALCFFRLLRTAFAMRDRDAWLLTLGLFFATAIFPYATQLWGHVTAAAFIVISLYFLFGRESSGPSSVALPTGAGWSGLFIGLAVLSEYSAAIPLVSLVAWLAISRSWRDLAAFTVGGLPPLAVHAIYHHQVFGSWLTVASVYNNPAFHQPDKLAGIFGGLQLDALWGLSFSLHSGLFSFMPWLLLVIPGVFMLGRGPGRALRLLGLFNVLAFLLMNMSFNGWHGGNCLGPRYLIPSLPFYVLLLAPAVIELRDRGGFARVAVIVLVSISAANMAVLAFHGPSTTALEQEAVNPLGRYYAALLRGEFVEQKLSPLRLDGDWTSQGRVIPARNAMIDLKSDPGAPASSRAGTGGSPLIAESYLRLKKHQSIRLFVGWDGEIRLTVNGIASNTRSHDGFEREILVVPMHKGENRVRIELPADSDGRFSVVAFASRARPRLPRATPEAPEHALGRTNGGELVGLGGVASLLPWLVVAGLLATLSFRALPR